MIEPAALRYFKEVANCGSLTAASETLGVATSAIGRQIRRLEEHFGTRLFKREARGMSLNAAGALLLEFFTRQSEEAEDFRSRFSEYLNIPRGRVRLVTIEGVLPRLMPEFVRAFHDAQPHIKLSVEVVGSNVAANLVAEQKADLGLLFGPSPRGDLIELAFMQQPLCLVVASSHPLAEKKACSVAEAMGHCVVLPDTTFSIRQEIDRVTMLSRIPLEITLETNSIALMRQIAAGGSAVTFLPRHAVFSEIESGILVAIPLLEKRFSKTKITLVRSAVQSPSTSVQRAMRLFRSMMAAER